MIVIWIWQCSSVWNCNAGFTMNLVTSKVQQMKRSILMKMLWFEQIMDHHNRMISKHYCIMHDMLVFFVTNTNHSIWYSHSMHSGHSTVIRLLSVKGIFGLLLSNNISKKIQTSAFKSQLFDNKVSIIALWSTIPRPSRQTTVIIKAFYFYCHKS